MTGGAAVLSLSFRPGAALVVGGTGNVGAGVVTQFARAGLPVSFTYRTNRRAADRLVQQAQDAGHTSQAIAMADDSASVREAIAAAEEFGGPLQTFAWAAGSPVPFTRIADFTPTQVSEFLHGDALSCFRVVREIVPVLRRNGGGSITLTTTIANRRTLVYDGISPFSKGALNALVRQIAAEEAPYGIRCNDVAVGIVVGIGFDELRELAELAEGGDADQMRSVFEQMAPMLRLGRSGTPEDAGNLFAFLASEQAAFITGQSIALDGGITL